MSAVFSADRRYRYYLDRIVDPLFGSGIVTFIGLNPSTADETTNDPTIRRCMGFARDWGYSQMRMINLYALCSTKPTGLSDAADPVGLPENDSMIETTCLTSTLVIAAWGNWGGPDPDRASHVLALPGVRDVHCLGKTGTGAPKHPLYLRSTTQPEAYR